MTEDDIAHNERTHEHSATKFAGLNPGYIRAAMEQALYERLEDSTVYGEIPGFHGLWATGATEEACAQDLASALAEWAAVRSNRGLSIPRIADLDQASAV